MFEKIAFEAQLRQQMPGWSDVQIDAYVDRMAVQHAHVLTGPDVIHLDYFAGLLDTADLETIAMTFKQTGHRLSYRDKTGIAYNNLEDFTLQVSYLLKNQIVQNVLYGVAGNALWEAIKFTTLLTWRKLRNKKLKDHREEEKSLNFGLSIQASEGPRLELKLSGLDSEVLASEALDKAFELIKEKAASPPVAPEMDNFYLFDESTKSWKKVNILAEIKKMHGK